MRIEQGRKNYVKSSIGVSQNLVNRNISWINIVSEKLRETIDSGTSAQDRNLFETNNKSANAWKNYVKPTILVPQRIDENFREIEIELCLVSKNFIRILWRSKKLVKQSLQFSPNINFTSDWSVA